MPILYGYTEAEVKRKIEAALSERDTRIADLEDTLSFVERWAVHHATKPGITAEEALSCIQHYPPIRNITDSYADGVRPPTFDPYARIAELEQELEVARQDARRWASHVVVSGDDTHLCRQCGHGYTPVGLESEDCPKCGSDGEFR